MHLNLSTIEVIMGSEANSVQVNQLPCIQKQGWLITQKNLPKKWQKQTFWLKFMMIILTRQWSMPNGPWRQIYYDYPK